MSDASPFELPPAEEVARLLPAYSELSFLAKGGMAAVYRGVQTSLDRPVAIKILPQEFGKDESFRLRFEAEGKAMAKLNHPNLVSIFDFGEVEGLLYLVMEFVEGETLFQHAHGQKMEESDAIAMCLQVAEGLSHAHQHGILHRDIKPANILLDKNGVPKLGDFGLAESEERADGDDLVFGTPGYTPPEVMANPAAADERADIFAIGVLLYELLTEQLPSDPYHHPSRLVQSDPRIDTLLAKTLQPDPVHRPATASQLADELRRLSEKLRLAPRRKLSTGGTTNAGTTLKVQKAPARPLATGATRAKAAAPAALSIAADGGEGTAPVAPAAPVAIAPSGPDFHLFRNLIIIAALCLAIWGAWNALQIKKERVAKEDQKKIEQQERANRKRKAAEIRAAREREEARSMLGNRPSSPSNNQPTLGNSMNPAPIVPEPTQLSPREQLEELKGSLAAGERTRFPDKVLKRGTSRFFFIEEYLTWHEAITFAESYGGHLAFAPKDNDLRWLATEVPGETGIWLGAGATSRSDWAWFDSSIDFEHSLRTSTGSAAMLSKLGILKSRHPSEKRPFFIEWEQSGPTPTTRQDHLQKLVNSLDSDEPAWPPGTLALEDRRYLIIAQPLSQSEARVIARSAGGDLAVPSGDVEASFFQDAATEAGLPTLWLGGGRKDDTWKWLTNEKWTFARWADSFPTSDSNASSLIVTKDGWQNEDPYRDIDGFIIEWSNDAKSAPVSDDEKSDTISSASELKAVAKRLLTKDATAHAKKIKDNSTAQGMALRQWLRNISKEEAVSLQPVYDDYLVLLNEQNQRLPSPESLANLAFPEKAAEILNRHYQQQLRIDQELTNAAEKVRTAFVRKLNNMVADFEARGLNSKLPALKGEIEAAGTNGEDFLSYLREKEES